jgi:hypothetical protein
MSEPKVIAFELVSGERYEPFHEKFFALKQELSDTRAERAYDMLDELYEAFRLAVFNVEELNTET